MKTVDELQFWIALWRVSGVGPKSFQKLLANIGDPESVFSSKLSTLTHAGISEKLAHAILDNKTNLEIAKPDIDWLNEADDHHIITWHNKLYPEQLKSLSDAPPLLYVRGDPEYLSQPQLAIVGSRNPTAAGRSTAKDFASHLSNAGITITSGLASGIDGASHEGALQGIAGTIAVVAHGLDIVYPANHQKLAQQITQHGAVISEMPIGTQPHPGLFPRRNRIISALALGTLVVEAAKKSGSLITARYALEQNREVFAIPGSIHNPMARGCHQLIRQGAKLVETADDILEELYNSLDQTTRYPQKPSADTQENPKDPPLALDPDHQKLLKCLAYEPASIDELVNRSQFNAAEVASMLLIMELEGIIVSQDGRYTCVS